MRLIPATPTVFAWLLGEGSRPDGVALPPDGVEAPETLKLLRDAGGETWLMVARGEAVGLCGVKRVQAGMAEIGYGVAPTRRRQGHASAAVPLLLGVLRARGLTAVAAETGPGNCISERVLERAGFRRAGARATPRGPVRLWWRPL